MLQPKVIELLSEYLGNCSGLCFVCKHSEHGGRGKCGCEEQCCYSIENGDNDASFQKMVESIIVNDPEFLLRKILLREKLRREQSES